MEQQLAIDVYQEALSRLEKKLGRGGIADRVIEDASAREQRPRREYDRKKLVASIGQWVRRSSVPREATFRDSLINVVNRELFDELPLITPKESFAQILQEIHERNFQNSIMGKAISRNLSDLFLRGIVLTPVTPANEIEQLAVGLGSWRFEGELPPYVPREVDDELKTMFNESKSGLIAISGPPKAGKTRTLIENLLLSRYRNHHVYWLSPTRGAVQGLLDALREHKHPQSVFVLDDFQRFSFDVDSGLTLDRLDELMSAGLVIATVHSSVLRRWENESFEKTKSNFDIPARTILARITESKVEIQPTLTDREVFLARAEQSFIDDNADTELKYLPSWLASVEVLTSRALRMISEGGMQSAVIRGLIDGYVLFPGGASVEALALLSQQHFANLQPNSIWHEEIWAQVLDQLTVGVTPQSPHSILTRVDGGLPKYLLFDAVWQNLRPENWVPAAIEKLNIHYRTAAEAAYSAGYFQAALSFLAPGLESEDWDDYWRAAKIAQASGEHELALSFLEPACEHNNSAALLEYGFVQEKNGLVALGKEFYLRAANLGNAQAMENLATHERNAGDYAAAKSWDSQAAALGHASSLHTISYLEFEDGNFVVAMEGFIEAAELGYSEAISALGWIYRTAEINTPDIDLSAIRKYLTAKADEGNNDCMIALAHIYWGEGNLSDAKRLLSVSDLPIGKTALVRGLIEEEEGGIASAKLFYQAGAASDSSCLVQLANIAIAENEFDDAQKFLMEAIQTGDRYAPNNLAVILQDIGRLSDAEKIWSEDASNWDSFSRKSHANLGAAYVRQGRFEDALVHLEFALSKNEKFALNWIGVCHLNLGHLVVAEEFFQQSISSFAENHAAAISNLAEIRRIQGRLEESRDLFEKSSALGDSWAQRMLALVSLELGDEDFAVLSLQKAIEMGDDQAGVLLEEMIGGSS